MAFQLEVLSRYNIHDVFHTYLLETYRPLAILKCWPLTPPLELKIEDKYEVVDFFFHEKKVVRFFTQKIVQSEVNLLVLQKGYPLTHATCKESNNHLINAPEVVHDFHLRYPHKPSTTEERIMLKSCICILES